MTSYNHNSSMPTTAPRTVFGAPVPMADPPAPAGTFAPGTKIQVGSQTVVIQKYFSEGGFAHVYLVKMPKPIDGSDIAVLKRVAVPDKEHLANMRTEVETMKKLKGHRPIVTYYDSHASQLKGGGYEVFLLMEFCNGGGLIDFMNTRLQNRLTEPEILKIFSDVSEGVACMHYLKPPLLHRDLKVENVLINATGSSKRFKLCDFGSTAPPRPAATTAAECRLIEEDVQKHTTLQYRSPEMVDVYRKQPIDEKSDIWALGVLLYKLCYYTTPFEAHGQLAILNASFKFPTYPPFSDPLKKLIASMLKENPQSRPNIYQVLREACLMQGLEVPLEDIYTGRTPSESRRNQQLPAREAVGSPVAVGAVYSPPPPVQQVIPDVPTAPRDLDQRVTEQLADDAFAMSTQPEATAPISGNPTNPVVSRAQKIISSNPELQAAASSAPSVVYQPTPTRPPTSSYVSQGTMTTPTPPTGQPPVQYAPASGQRFPHTTETHRASSLPRNQEPASTRSHLPRSEESQTRHPAAVPRTSSRTRPVHARHPSSSRPSLEAGRPSLDVLDPVPRTKSSNSRPRPSSTYLESNMDFLREKEKEASGRPSLSDKRPSYKAPETAVVDSASDEETNIESNVDFLRTIEDHETAKKDRRRSSGGKHKSKRASLSSMSLSGTKNLLAGKFGDAFKRFEHNANAPPPPRTPSPLHDMERRDLTPIAGSEATDGRSDDGNILEDADHMAPEQRREIERRRLSLEEQRVASAAAEYRRRVADRGPTAPRSIGGVSRAASIQHKVKSLLDENQAPSPGRPAEGYGRFTDSGPSAQVSRFEASSNPYAKPAASIPRKPLVQTTHSRSVTDPSTTLNYAKPRAALPPPSQPIACPVPATTTKMSVQEKEDYMQDFSRRFPSLSGIEMVETTIEAGVREGAARSRDV
ncbi:nak/nak-unclassified protein kinase [Diplocarpon rosae]|nr:nak/nak-unclassified protein kinase [Diplocarpon rosae]